MHDDIAALPQVVIAAIEGFVWNFRSVADFVVAGVRVDDQRARLARSPVGDLLAQEVRVEGGVAEGGNRVALALEARVDAGVVRPAERPAGGAPPSPALLARLDGLGLDVTADLAQRRALRQSLLVGGGVIAVAVAAVNLVLLGRALAPLARLAAQARRINPASPLSIQHKGPHDEVAYVAQALNRALRGIRKRQQAERASLAEIAHELAAPLTLVAGHLESLRARHPDDARLGAAQAAANELLYTSKDLLQRTTYPPP